MSTINLAHGFPSQKEINKNKVLSRRSNYVLSARRTTTGKKSQNSKTKQWRRDNLPTSRPMPTIHEETCDEQFGLESISTATFAIDALSKFANIDVPDKILREVEGVILLLVNLTQQTTALGVSTSVLTWAQGRTTRSLFKTVKEYIDELLITPQSDATPDWLDCLRDMKQNWQLCKNNRAFKQVSKLLGCLVMLGLCDISQVSFSLGDFKLFTPELCSKHTTSFDIADAIFETVIFFTEGAYLCIKSGSLKPLLINDRTAMELDHEYAQIVAWFDLVKNGNLKKFADLSDHEFEKRLNRLSTSLSNLAQSLGGMDKKLVMDKFQKTLIMQNDFVSMKIASGVRHAPWAIELFGESSQGKTTLADQLIDAVLTSQGLPTDKEFRCAYNAGDKFMSNWTSDKLVMIFDDISNAKAQFVEKPPTQAVIDVVNNQMFYAPKAELEAKGKCFVEPWIAVATTNKQDMDAGLYSNCPYSIQRRLVCITVTVKPEFQRIEEGVTCGIDPSKVRAHYTKDGVYSPPLYDDIWVLTVSKAAKPSDMMCVADYFPISHKGKIMKDISMHELIQWAIDDFGEHKKNQEAMLDSMRTRNRAMKVCGHEGCRQIKGNCPAHDMLTCPPCEEQFGHETVSSIRRLFYAMPNHKGIIDGVYDKLDYEASKIIYEKGTQFMSTWDWIKLVPAPAFDNEHMPNILRWLYKKQLTCDYKKATFRSLCTLVMINVLLFTQLSLPFAIQLSVLFFIEFLWRQRNLLDAVEKTLFEDLRKRNFAITPMLRTYRDKYAKHICAASIGIAVLYGLARAYRAYAANLQDSQGSLEPKTPEQVQQRDSEVNVWTSVTTRALPITESSKTISHDQLENVVKRALVYGSVHHENGNGMVNGLMLSSNVILIPDHYFEQFGDDLSCTFRKKNPEATGGKFTARISKLYTHLIPNTDLRVCYVPNGGSFKNLIKYFPLGIMPATPFALLWRNKEGDFVVARGVTQPGIVQTTRPFEGGMYRNLTMNTFAGLCGAALISETQGSVILGVHLGGTSETPIGCYGSITQDQLTSAFEKLRSMEGVVLSGQASHFESAVMGINVMTPTLLHSKSAVNYLPEDSQIEYLGSCIGRARAVSEVKVTPISAHLLDVCNNPNIYHGPSFNPEWLGWQDCLANMAIPATPYQHALLVMAVMDYKSDLLPIFRNSMWRRTRKLTAHENLCGVPGKKFLDAIKLGTAIGFPLSGPKRDYVEELEPTPDKPNNRKFDEVILIEIERVRELYKKGERANVIAKGCKKDEILSKKKCRIFYSNPIQLTYLIREYFLPILRVLQMNPLKSECAVGINSHGPEWQQFHEHATKFGEDRLFGGDYGKYDQKLPAQLIFAALRILIDFARECDYSDEDIRVMEAMTGDIVFAYIAFNGDLIGLTEGTHISGNSLTVIINGICGSLNLRCYFYSEYPANSFEERMPFRKFVAISTYGDDNIGSVHPDIDKFTIKGCSKFLEEYGQVYTMPDKESELQDFLAKEDFEFLKRSSIYHPKLGLHIGALSDKSIYKSLHCFMRSKNSVDTEEYACAINVDGALREWFNHGEEKYEAQRLKMIEVTKRAAISHMCIGLELTYDDRVQRWEEQYRPE